MDRFKFRIWDKFCKNWFTDFAINQDGEINRFFNNEEALKRRFVLMQSTGLHDKNGKLIYEGDIVKKQDYNALGYFRERICTVFWWNRLSGWAIETTLGDAYRITDYKERQLEVIGNIYENADLLQKESE